GRTVSASNRPDGGVRREARQGEEGGSARRLCKGLRDLPPLPQRAYWRSRSAIGRILASAGISLAQTHSYCGRAATARRARRWARVGHVLSGLWNAGPPFP